jgi:hypothetical protein
VSNAATIIINFNQVVLANTISFEVRCPGTLVAYTPTPSLPNQSASFILTPTSGLPIGSRCTVTVVGNQIVDAATQTNHMASDFLFSFQVPPVATDDRGLFTATGNMAISPAGSVLQNDLGSQDPPVVSTVQGTANVGSFVRTTQGGQIKLNTDGKFTYDPPPGFDGQDTFTYQITNAGGTSAAATVAVTVTDMMWFVCNGCGNALAPQVPSANSGTLLDPFTSIGAFSDVNTGVVHVTNPPQPNQNIYVRSGSPYTGNRETLKLLNGQVVDGQEVAASSIQLVSGRMPNTATDPTALATVGTSTRPTLQPSSGDAIDVAGNNTVRHLNVGSTAPGATHISSPSTGISGSLTVSNASLGTDPTPNGRPLALANLNLNITLDSVSNTSSSSGGPAMSLTAVSGTLTINGGSVQGTTDGAALSVTGGTLTIAEAGTLAQSNPQPLVSVSNGHTGSLTFSNNLSATNGTGLQFNGANGTYVLNGPVTLNGGDAGIDVQGGSKGTIDISSTSSAITNPASQAVQVSNNGASLAFTYAGSITKNNGGTGITVSGNTGGTITLSGATTLMITTAAPAVSVTNNTTTNVNFGSGGLSIVSASTATGDGFDAAAGGTITLTSSGTNNTISTATGTALNITNTTIGAQGMTFTSIAAGTNSAGPRNGIVLTNLGTAGSLTVTGIGSTSGSGGTIQNSSGDGVSVSGDANVKLQWMNVTNGGSSGVLGNSNNGSLTMDIRTSTFSNNLGGLQCANTGSGTATCNVLKNLFTGQTAGSILVRNGSASSCSSPGGGLTARIQSNTVNQPATGSSSPIDVRLSGCNTLSSLLIDGNTVVNNGQGDGISVTTPDANTSPSAAVQVTDNTVTMSATGLDGIHLAVSQPPVTCLSVGRTPPPTPTPVPTPSGSNTASAGGAGPPTTFGISLESNGVTVQLERGREPLKATSALVAKNPTTAASLINASATAPGVITLVNDGFCVVPSPIS